MSDCIIYGKFREDGSADLLGRLTARGAAGATQDSGRNLVRQADLSSAVLKAFDVDSSTPDTALVTTTLTIASVIYDTLQTTWDKDSVGYNFYYQLPATVCTTGGHRYDVEIKWTATSGTVMWTVFKGMALPVRSS